MARLAAITFLWFFAWSATAQPEQILVYEAQTYKCNLKTVSTNSNTPVAIRQTAKPNWQFPGDETLYDLPQSRFSEMAPTAKFTNTDMFPASANVKIVSIRGDTTWDRCSGMMVGDKYVLTAGHCVLADLDPWADKKGFVPYLHVKPGFDQGVTSEFGTIKVIKTYIFKSYFDGKSKKDVALLELDQPIGERTGWVKLGFENDKQTCLNTRYCNFSYPMDASRLGIDRTYNGDTLYIKAGYPDLVSQDYIGINSPGIPGESGSLLLAKDDENWLTAYGVRNFSEEWFSFYRLKEEDVRIFNSILKSSSPVMSERTNLTNSVSEIKIAVSPNPMFDNAIISTSSSVEQIQVVLYDASNKAVYEVALHGDNGKFLFENRDLPPGNYILVAKQNNAFLGYTKIAIRK